METEARRFLSAQLRDVLVRPSASIHKVIEVIDGNAAKIALVTDADERLLGTITDGDIRRGILRGVPLTATAARVMNRRPRTATPDEPRATILGRMRLKGLYQMPVVDPDGRVLGLEVAGDSLRPGRDNLVVLMVGGLGTRLGALTQKTPKPLLSVGPKPILETILESFVAAGFRRFYFSVNYKNEMVRAHFGAGRKWGVDIRYLHEEARLGTAGSLSLLPETPKKPVIVMNGDLLTKIDFDHLLDFHQSSRVSATLCVREYDFQVPYGVVRTERHRVRSIDEKPIQRFFVNAGIYVLEPPVLGLIPKKKPLDMPVLFEKLLRRKKNVAAFPIREYWLDIGRLDDLERANGDFGKIFS